MGEFGRYIAKRRKYMGLTQAELADRLRVSKSAVAKWEVEGGFPDRDNLSKLAAEINVSISDLHRMILKTETDLKTMNITPDIISVLESYGYKVILSSEDERKGGKKMAEANNRFWGNAFKSLARKTLIVVARDEMLLNQMRKMEREKEEKENEQADDNRLNIVLWDAKTWKKKNKKGKAMGHILFLGKLKGYDDLIPVVDVKFDRYGVKYGWAGDRAVLWVKPKKLADPALYDAFIEEMAGMEIPEQLKKGNALKDKKIIRRQMLFYGLMNMYDCDLKAFGEC